MSTTLLYNCSVVVQPVQYPVGVDHIYAYITGGSLLDDTYFFHQMHIYWGPEGEMGSENQIDSQR